MFTSSAATFTVYGVIDAYEWQAGDYGVCTVPCGGGTASRSVTCKDVSSGSTVADSFCNSGYKPAATVACNTLPCPNKCPAVGICDNSAYYCEPCSCKPQFGGDGYFCGARVISASTGQTVMAQTGCDTTVTQPGSQP